jgi:hypothetical protein
MRERAKRKPFLKMRCPNGKIGRVILVVNFPPGYQSTARDIVLGISWTEN